MALIVALADYRLAKATQSLSLRVAEQNEPARFSAEWTARYQLEKEGWTFWHPSETLSAGDRVLLYSNAGSASPPEGGVVVQTYVSPERFPIRTLDWRIDAGYHSEQLGRLPIAWGHGPLVEAQLLEMPNSP